MTLELSLSRCLASPPSMNDLDGRHWAPLNRVLAPWRQTARLALQDAWRRPLSGWADVAGRPAIVTLHLGFTVDRGRDPQNYHRLAKALVDELHAGISRRVGRHLVREPRPWALWPDDGPEWVTVAEPVLTVGSDRRELKVQVR